MNINNIFSFHVPTEQQIEAMTNVREQARILAQYIVSNVPAGADQAAAIRKVREAVMTANAGIVLNGQL